MTAAVFQSRDEALAGGLAFAMHVLFLVLLVFGVSWQHKPVETAAVVDLWRDLPSAAAPTVEEVPPAPIKPEPPPPQPKVEAKPPPKPEPAPVAKPDIALKDKREKELKLKAQLEEKKRAEEKARAAEAENKKRAEADALKKKQVAEAEAKRVASEQAKAQEALAAQQAAASKREIDKYMDGIRTKVKRALVVPPSVQGNPEAEVVVTLLPGGEVLNVRVKKSSGNSAYDAAVERAVRLAQNYVVPTGDDFQRNFREFTMVFRPLN
jgi:colicin import membrane protein